VKWSRRRPASAALIAVSVLATVLLVAGGAYFVERLAKERNDTVDARNDESIQREKAVQAAKDEGIARAAAVTEKEQADAARAIAVAERERADASRSLAEQQRDRAEWLAYSAQLSKVQREWNRGNSAAEWSWLAFVLPEWMRLRYRLGITCQRW
jgi:hypothetical protein